MRNLLACLLLGVALASGYVAYTGTKPPPPAQPTPAPVIPPCPGPGPCPVPQPKPSPWGPRGVRSVDLKGAPQFRPLRPSPGGMAVGGPVGPGGVEVMCDLPVPLRKKNIGGTDGAGLCVFTSIMHSARYQGERALWDFQEKMAHERGGGYPDKVDKMIKKYAPGVHYAQVETNDPSSLEMALKCDRMPGVTYNGHDPHYGGSIGHMVNLVYLDQNSAAILDNNFIGEDELVWMTRQDFLQRWKGDDRTAWAVFLLHPGPAPVPLKK